MSSFSFPLIIEKKRDGKELSKEEIDFFIKSVVDATIQDSQIGDYITIIIVLFLFELLYYSVITRRYVPMGHTLQGCYIHTYNRLYADGSFSFVF